MSAASSSGSIHVSWLRHLMVWYMQLAGYVPVPEPIPLPSVPNSLAGPTYSRLNGKGWWHSGEYRPLVSFITLSTEYDPIYCWVSDRWPEILDESMAENWWPDIDERQRMSLGCEHVRTEYLRSRCLSKNCKRCWSWKEEDKGSWASSS